MNTLRMLSVLLIFVSLFLFAQPSSEDNKETTLTSHGSSLSQNNITANQDTVVINPTRSGYHLGVPQYDPLYYQNLEETAKRYCQELGYGYGVKSYQVNTYGGDYTYYYHYWRTGSHSTVYRITVCECNDPL